MCFNPLLASALFHVISKPDSELNPIKVVFSFLSAAETRKVFICEKKKITPLLCTLQRDAH